MPPRTPPVSAALGLSLFTLLTACQAYRPAPIDLASLRDAWALPDFTSEHWAAVADSASLDAPPDLQRLTVRYAVALAVFGNPDLRRARLEAGVADAAATHAGRWDDPALDLGVLNNLDADSDEWILGASLGFTLPLSGRLAVAQQQADASAVEAWTRIAEDEWRLARRVAQTWTQWAAADQQAAALAAYLDDVAPLADAADRLADAGELAPTDARLLRVQLVQRRIELATLRHTAEQRRLELLALLGLRPDAGVAFARGLPDAPPPREPTDPAMHPAVASALAAYDAAELALQREVRKQYPDLTIGPAVEHEEGQSRLGLGLGLPLPLWNANRAGIAQATAARAAAAAAVEAADRDAAAEFAQAHERRRAADDIADATLDDLLPLVEAQVAEARALLDLGEVDVLLLHEALDAVADARLAAIDTTAEAAAAALDLHHLTAPHWAATPKGTTP